MYRLTVILILFICFNTAAQQNDGYPKYYIEATQAAQALDYEEAITLFEKSYALEEASESTRVAYLNSMNAWMAHCYRELGRYEKAIEYIDKSLENTGELGAESDLASLYANKSVIYHEWGDYENSVVFHLKSIQELKHINRGDLVAIAYNNVSEVYRAWGKYDLALAYADTSYSYNYAANFTEGMALNWVSKALAYNHNEMLDSAFHYASLAYNTAVNNDLTNTIYTAGITLSEVYIATGDISAAKRYLKESLDGLGIDLKEHHPLYTRYLDDYIRIYLHTGSEKEALETYENLFSNLELQLTHYFPSLNEKAKGLFYRKIKSAYERFNALVVAKGNQNGELVGKMYDYQLKVKGLLLNNSRLVRKRILSSEDDSLIYLYKTWVSKRELLAKAYAMTQEERSSRGLNIKDIENKKNEIEVLLSKSTSLFTKPQKVVEWKDLQKRLKKEDAIVEIVRVRDYDPSGIGKFTDKVNYAAMVVKKGDKHPKMVVMGEGSQMENAYYKYYLNNIKFESLDAKSYDRYWSPIEKELSGIEKVYFAADGIYHKINLNTLYNKKEDNNLIDKIEINLLTSSKDLLELNKDAKSSSTAVLIGNPKFEMTMTEVKHALNTKETHKIETENHNNPIYLAEAIMRTGADQIQELPGTQKEISKIASLLEQSSWKIERYEQQFALEEFAKKIVSPTILHFATHGYFLNTDTLENPLLASGLILAGAVHNQWSDQLDDGYFTAYEVMNLNLENTDIVILSACETGLGEVKNGEGVYGLQRAFIVAGAESIIMSLWKVSDEATALLMTHFYQNYLKSNDKHDAFAKAQKEVRKEYPNPKYWGAFVLIGN